MVVFKERIASNINKDLLLRSLTSLKYLIT